MTPRLNFVLATLILLVGGPFWWLLLDTSAGSSPPRRIDIAELRRLAGAIPGQKPKSIDMELAGWRLVPGDTIAAGSGLKRRLVGINAFRLDVPGQKPIMIDSGTSLRFAKAMDFDRFDSLAQDRINEGLREASLIVVTHEHLDHIGGLATIAATADGPAVLSHARLSPRQLPTRNSIWPRGTRLAAGLKGLKAEAVAPGVVVFPAPGHTPGSQMIYVMLDSGEEYLFPGDTVSFAANWLENRPRSRLVTDWLSPEDRPASTAWLKAVVALKQENPKIHIVASHDYEWLRDPKNHSGIYGRSSQGAENVSGN